jgi:hypothetical protein
MRRPYRAEARSSRSDNDSRTSRFVNPAGRVMRRIDDDESCLGPDRGLDRLEIEVEGRRLQADLARHDIGREQHRLVTEPSGFGDHRLVAGVEHQAKRHHDRREGARRQRNVCRFEGEPELAPQAFGDKGLRLLLTRFVCEPILVARYGAVANS